MLNSVYFVSDISLVDAGITAVLGYLVVFVGLALLMAVVLLMGRIMTARKQTEEAVPAAASAAAVPAAHAPQPPAPGSAGEIKLYDVSDRDAAMIMAIVADRLGKPLNELRFLSVREIKEDDRAEQTEGENEK